MEEKLKEMIRAFEMSEDPNKDGEAFCFKVTETLWSAHIYDSQWIASETFRTSHGYAKHYAVSWNDKAGLHLVHWTAKSC